MIVYNVSLKVLNDYCAEWDAMDQAEHRPAVVTSHGCFTSYEFNQFDYSTKTRPKGKPT